MVRRHLKRLKYEVKGWWMDRNRFEFGENLPSYKKEEREEEKHKEREHALQQVITERTQASHKHTRTIREKKASKPESEKSKYLAPPTFYTQKSEFHTYKKGSKFSNISKALQQKGLPPLPIMLLLLIILLSAIFPLYSIGFLFFEPTEVGIFIAIQKLDGNVLKNATVFLTDTSSSEYSAEIAADGTAYFPKLAVGETYSVHAMQESRRINVEERELKVPFRRGRNEIIIVMRAVN